MPPAHTGVADYAAALLGELRKRGRVEIAPERCDVALYHTGNNSLHREIYARALSRPGVAVLHDAVLHHFLLGVLTRDEYIEEFVYNYGAWARGEAEMLWENRAASAQDPRYFARPMLKRIAERSRAVVVHNPAARDAVLAHAPSARVVEIPHFFAPAETPDAAAVMQFRQRIGAPPGTVLFGVFGYLRESKRLLPVLRAFERLRGARSPARLLIAGENTSEALERAIRPLVESTGAHRIGYMSPALFQLAAAAVDCCINLRYPRAGETSGTGIHMMGTGKPVIVTEGPEYARFPPEACMRVPPGVAEEATLFEYMVTVGEFPEFGRRAGRAAADHIRKHHSLEAVAGQYWNVLCDSCC